MNFSYSENEFLIQILNFLFRNRISCSEIEFLIQKTNFLFRTKMSLGGIRTWDPDHRVDVRKLETDALDRSAMNPLFVNKASIISLQCCKRKLADMKKVRIFFLLITSITSAIEVSRNKYLFGQLIKHQVKKLVSNL